MKLVAIPALFYILTFFTIFWSPFLNPAFAADLSQLEEESDSSFDPRQSTESGACLRTESKGVPPGLSGARVANGLSNLVDQGAQAIAPFLKTIEESPAAKRLASEAKKITLSFAANGQKLKCWRGVKELLTKAKLISPGELTSRYARRATNDLKAKGFVNLLEPGRAMANLRNPCLAPAGSVLVYEGGLMRTVNLESGEKIPSCGSEPCGHVEVKIGASGTADFASDFRTTRPPTGGCWPDGNTFHLKSILVPPDSIGN